jgi:hypothetical protein
MAKETHFSTNLDNAASGKTIKIKGRVRQRNPKYYN